jgi:3-oxoacyl-[acyl-carrier-protein] synthase III
VATIHKFGNTTSATIPLCLLDFEPRLKSSDRLLMAAFGGTLDHPRTTSMGQLAAIEITASS